jgi:predicted pyridoxine 5'-phosphate oxidase superfamily flavin-nucleotide-binding protein
MAKLTEDMQFMITNQQCFIATVNKTGVPNVAPKRSAKVLNESTIIFTEGTGGTTYKNLIDGSIVSIGVVNKDEVDGYRFVGKADVQESGSLYDQAVIMSQLNGIPKPKAVVLINIETIHSLRPGLCVAKIIKG